jgi:hypothetical protein
VRCEKAQNLSGRVETHPATFAPAGSSESRRSGNEAAEAFEVKGLFREISARAGRHASEHGASLEKGHADADLFESQGRLR